MQQDEDMLPLSQQPEPGTKNKEMPVPQDLVHSGHDTAEPPHTDSPESLDDDIAQGTDRERIDPHHSITRPAIDTIDKEQNGAD